MCSVDGCTRRASTKGMCKAHYYRWVRCGDVQADRPIGSLKNGKKPHDPTTCVICLEVPALAWFYPCDELAERLGYNPEAMHRHIKKFLPAFTEWSRPAANDARREREVAC